MSYIGQSPTFGDFPFQVLTGDGSQYYNLNFQVSSEKGMLVFLNGAIQRPTTDFTAAGTLLSFTGVVAVGVQIFVYGMGLPKSTLQYTDSFAGSVPLFSVQWWPNRNYIPAGYVPGDGQLLSRVGYTEAWAGIAANNVPSIADATWLSTPTERGKYSGGDGTTTFRTPDYNGKAAGSLGALFLRGDGALSAAVNGVIQLDALKSHNHTQTSDGKYSSNSLFVGNAGSAAYSTINGTGYTGSTGDVETRPLNVTGCWIIKMFGAVTNSGNIDVAAIAAQYTTLFNGVDFTIVYPNGGTQASPASVAINSRYVSSNPFPGYQTIVQAQVLTNSVWSNTGWIYAGGSYGVVASILDNGDVVVQTGSSGITTSSIQGGGGHNAPANIATPLPCRVLVWKVRGTI